MKPTRTGDTWARFDDGTCWALPDRDDDIRDSLGYRLAHAEPPSKSDLYQAVSTLGCYEALILLPQRERNKRVAAIREAMRMRDATRPAPNQEPAK